MRKTLLLAALGSVVLNTSACGSDQGSEDFASEPDVGDADANTNREEAGVYFGHETGPKTQEQKDEIELMESMTLEEQREYLRDNRAN